MTNQIEGRTARRRAEQSVLANVQPFRITSVKESILLREAFVEASGLEPHQFVQNSWGFPFIPIPEPANYPGLTRPRLVPKGASPRFFGHPIFWMDPDLTAATSEEREDTVRWSIRMFYLMLSFGLLDPTSLRFVDVILKDRGRHNPDDIERYLKGDASDLDDILYGEKDLLVPYEEVQRQTERAISRILELQTEERRRIHITQVGALRDAQKMLRDDTRWKAILDRGLDISWKTRNDAANGQSISEYVDPYYTNMQEAAQHLTGMDKASMILSIHTSQTSAVTTSMYAKTLAVFERLENVRLEPEYPAQLGQLVESVFSGEGGFPEDTATSTVYTDALDALYGEARDRLELAFANCMRAQKEEVLYSSLIDKELEESVREIAKAIEG